MKRSLLCGLTGLLAVSVLGCSTLHLVKSKPARPYNREAMRHMITGAVEDLMGQPKDALVEYHQAAEIDSASGGIYLAIAENYFYLEEYNSSIRLVKKALQRSPKNVDAWELLAANHEKLRQYKEAALDYEQINRLEPDNIQTLYSLATFQIITRDFTHALNSYRRLVDLGLADPDYRLRIGHLFLQNRAWDQAESVYRDVNKSDPNFESAYLALAAVSKARKDTLAAVRWYRQALTLQPSFEDVKSELRGYLERSGRLDEAITVYQDLVRRDSTNITDQLQLGQYYFQKGDTTGAIKWIEQVIARYPQSERAYLALGALRRAQKDTAAAEQAYRSGLAQNIYFLDVRRRLRDLLAAQRRWDEAISLYDPLKNIDTTYVGSRIEIANLLAQKGDTTQAILQCEELAKLHGDDWRVPFTLGRLYFMKSDNRAARSHFEKTLQLRDDLPLIWVLRGVNFLQMDSLAAAEDNFSKAAEKFPEDPEVLYYLGFVYNREKKTDQAIEYMEKAQQVEEDNPTTLLALAALYDERKDHTRAEVLYEKLLKLNPSSAMVLNNYAYHLAVRNLRLPQAREMIDRALTADSTNAAYWDTAGWIDFQLGDYASAKQKIEKSIALQGDSAEVVEHLGDVYEKLGDWQTAKKYWQKSLDMDPSRTFLKDKMNGPASHTDQRNP